MRPSFLPFCKPSLDEEDIRAVVDCLRSGWITTGARCAELEEAFRARTGARHAVAATSGTALMHLALEAIGIGPGDEVVTPSMTWVSTCNLVELMGARCAFIDVDRDTLLAGVDAAEAAITPRTKAVIPVHYGGAPVDIDAWRAMCARRGITLIEDAAHALGTQCRGREIGGGGTAIFSLHPIKNITTGEGGVLTTDDAALAERVRRLRFHGLALETPAKGQQGRSPTSEVVEPGYKYNLPDMNATLGLGQMRRLDALNARRRELMQSYRSDLAGIEGITPLADPAWPHTHAAHLMVVRVDESRCGIDRGAFMAGLKARNIGTGIHFLAAHTHRWYRENRPATGLPNTEWNSERVCTIPLFPGMTEEDRVGVVAAIKETLAEARGRTRVSMQGASR